jgi:hypothetical protein
MKAVLTMTQYLMLLTLCWMKSGSIWKIHVTPMNTGKERSPLIPLVVGIWNERET